MVSIDRKDAYYSVLVATDHRKFLMFAWDGKFYQYTCLPNGLACAPRYFTKLSKLLFSIVSKESFICTNYIDDCPLYAKTEEECVVNIKELMKLS